MRLRWSRAAAFVLCLLVGFSAAPAPMVAASSWRRLAAVPTAAPAPASLNGSGSVPVLVNGTGPNQSPDTPAWLLVEFWLFGVDLLPFGAYDQDTFLTIINETLPQSVGTNLSITHVVEVVDGNYGTPRTTGPIGGVVNSSDANLPHVQLTIRIATTLGKSIDLQLRLVQTADAGLLPLLQQQKLDVEDVTLQSLVLQETDTDAAPAPGSSAFNQTRGGGLATVPAPSPNTTPQQGSGGSGLSPAMIAVIVILGVLALAAGVVVAVYFGGYSRGFGLPRHKTSASSSSATSNAATDVEAALDGKADGGGGVLRADGSVAVDAVGALVARREGSSGSDRSGALLTGAEFPFAAADTVLEGVRGRLPPDAVIGFTELAANRLIGEGSFGRVFLGRWRETTVAIKVLSPQAAAVNNGDQDFDAAGAEGGEGHEAAADIMAGLPPWPADDGATRAAVEALLVELHREADIMAGLRHPNIVQFLGICLAPPCMVTEFCARGSLLDVLRRARVTHATAAQLNWGRRLGMALDAAKGMLYLHSRQPPILHRDLKSANLLVDKFWKVKVADFNLSRVMHASSVVSSVAATNPRWLAPEVLTGRVYNTAADVYAFGIIMWELLTFQIPWEDLGPWQVVIAVVDQRQRPELPAEGESGPPGMANLPPDGLLRYADLMRRCWAEEAAARPSFEAIIAQLRALLEEQQAIDDSAMRHAVISTAGLQRANSSGSSEGRLSDGVPDITRAVAPRE